MHVQHLVPAGIDQCLHDEPGKTTPTELFKSENAVNFVPVRVQPAPCYRCEGTVDKGAEDAFLFGVWLLLAVVIPERSDKGKFGCGEFAGEGGWWGKRNSLYDRNA